MDIDKLTIGEAKELACLFSVPQRVDSCACPWKIGKVYLIRTVTMIDLGRVVQVTAQEIVLEDACWIADTGRWADALKGNTYKEQEPYPEGRQVLVGRGAIVDAVEVSGVVRSQK